MSIGQTITENLVIATTIIHKNTAEIHIPSEAIRENALVKLAGGEDLRITATIAIAEINHTIEGTITAAIVNPTIVGKLILEVDRKIDISRDRKT